MSNNHQLQHKQLSTRRDLRIRWALFRALVIELFSVKQSNDVVSVSMKRLVPAMLIVMLVFGALPWWGYQQFEQTKTSIFLGRVYAHETERIAKRETNILTEHLLIEEGADKAKFVAKKYNIPLEDAERVPVRKDDVKIWAYSHHQKSEVETILPGNPKHINLFYATGSKLHIFLDKPNSCASESKTESISQGCGLGAVMEDTPKQHRALFDKSHNISELYKFAEDPHAQFPLIPRSMSPIKSDDPTQSAFEISLNASTTAKLYFDKDSAVLKKQVIILTDMGESYEMAVVHHLEESIVEPNIAGTIFNPSEHKYQELEVLPL